ncbi:MAG: peroxiredoxin [Candidatus Thermoplasmatota archaeon]|jgi:peroxiredoxin|nr:peroxiredoxin [Candidatus Thermoplasmatota archaeon]MCL5254040.1 peroxiredoxin [Candidatus Thermoplasmatota archaeon]
MAEIKVGDKAPDFALPKSRDQKVLLKDLIKNGKAVIAFYPGDFSSVCTNEWCSLRDNFSDFEKLDAKVVGISGDSHFTHEAFKKANSLNFDLLSDYDHQVSKLYNVYYEDFLGMKGVSKRSVFIVDREGKIRYKWVTEDASKLPDVEEIKRELAKIN